jgi:phosphoheptose isomerase
MLYLKNLKSCQRLEGQILNVYHMVVTQVQRSEQKVLILKNSYSLEASAFFIKLMNNNYMLDIKKIPFG